MQFKQLFSGIVAAILLAGVAFSAPAAAAPKDKKTYDEIGFLQSFSGKSRKQVAAALGQPLKKEQSVKPSNADSFVSKVGSTDKSKPVNVEMWYYTGIVRYDDKRTYKSTELTFVNDRCQNIAFFNNK